MKFNADEWCECECELTVPKTASRTAMDLMNRNPDTLNKKDKWHRS